MKLDDFTSGYLECALWACQADEAVVVEDIPEDLLAEAVAECADFQETNAADLDEYQDRRVIRPGDGSALAHAGHDFYLTREGHGVGFWARGLGSLGDRLTEATKARGSADNLTLFAMSAGGMLEEGGSR